MSISREGLNLLKELEGFRPRAVSLANGRWLIGYGHTKFARANMRITEQEAELLLRHDMLAVIEELNTKIFAPVSQGQFDALALFAYNIGLQSFRASGICNLLNIGQPLAAANELGRWRVAMVNGAPVVIDALARRRAAELNLFLRTPDLVRPATTHLLTPLSEQTPETFDSPLQVFRPAPVPVPVPAPQSEPQPAPQIAPPPIQSAAPPPPPVPPRPPSTLRTRFHDLIARRRIADDLERQTRPDRALQMGDTGAALLGVGIVLFMLIGVLGVFSKSAALVIGGFAAAALCASTLLRLLDRPKASPGGDTPADDDAPPT